jgi:diguanylate cyclase (GGDEF)-like protein
VERPTAILAIKDLIAEARQPGFGLVIVAGHAEIGRSFRLAKTESVVGRAGDADVTIDGEGISRRHCRVVVRDDGTARLEDLGSTNGTLVNGKRVEAIDLHDGDKLQLGDAVVVKFAYQDRCDEEMLTYLYDAATRDPLTGLYNKKFMMEALEKDFAFSKRHGTPLSLVVLDIDRFKQVNDTHGHLAGDTVLRKLAETVLAVSRGEDVFARFGGEEFVLVADGCGAENAFALAERLRRRVEETEFTFQGRRIPVTVSAGVATTTGVDYVDVRSFLAEADRQLYRAKEGGRNRVEPVPGPDDDETLRFRAPR